MKTEWLATGRGYEIPCTFSIGRENTKVCVVAHGFGSSKESPTVQMLLKALPEQGIGVAAFDFQAHGESRVDGEYLRIPNCTADLADVEALARTLAPGAEITYFGSSFGAYTTLIYLSGLPGGEGGHFSARRRSACPRSSAGRRKRRRKPWSGTDS